MKISSQLSKEIVELSLQLKTKFDICIGYSHPMGCFIEDTDDFIIIEDGDLVVLDEENHIFDFKNMRSYLVEANPFCEEREGILVKLNHDYEQTSERIIDFLINFHSWLKSGELKIEEYREYKNYKWKPAGDGRFSVEKIDPIPSP